MCLKIEAQPCDKKRQKYNSDRHATIIGMFHILNDRQGRQYIKFQSFMLRLKYVGSLFI